MGDTDDARRGAAADDALVALQAHIARELHDEVAQPMIALVIDLGQLRRRGQPVGARDLAVIEDAARQILRRMREMLMDLRGHGELGATFIQALKNELRIGGPNRPTLKVSTGWPRRISAWAAFNLLRIVQEAVANAQQHGHAQNIEVFLEVGAEGDGILVVRDDGVGMDAALGGYGMIGMRERAEILGGTLEVQPQETGGTRVEVRVPGRSLI